MTPVYRPFRHNVLQWLVRMQPVRGRCYLFIPVGHSSVFPLPLAFQISTSTEQDLNYLLSKFLHPPSLPWHVLWPNPTANHLMPDGIYQIRQILLSEIRVSGLSDTPSTWNRALPGRWSLPYLGNRSDLPALLTDPMINAVPPFWSCIHVELCSAWEAELTLFGQP